MRLVPSISSLLVAAALLAPSAAARPDAAADAEAAKKIATLVERIKSTDPEVRKAAVTEAKTEQHPAVTAALLHGVSDTDAGVRKVELEALVARTDPTAKKQAASAVAARLPRLTAKPDDHDELMRSLAALHDLAQPVVLKALTDRLGLDVEAEELAARLKAIANLPTADAVEAIIQFRASGGNQGGARELGYRRRMARQAFKYATGEDVGNDPDAMRKWWKEHEKGFNYEAAGLRRAKEGGGPTAKDGDGSSPDTGAKPPK